MKILMVHNRYQTPGGEGQTFERESSLLEQFGHQVYRYTRENQDISNTISKLEAGVRVVWSQDDYRKIRKIISEFHPDIIHVHNFFPLISPSVYYAAKSKIPVIQTLQNYRLWCLNGYFIRDQSPCEICLNKKISLPGIVCRCYRNNALESSAVACMQTIHDVIGTWKNRVDRYIVTTEFFKEKAIQGGLPSSKLSIKPNFVDPDPGKETKKEDFLIYVGRLFPEKGIRLLLKAWTNYRDLPPIKLIGQGPMESDVKEIATQLSNVEYLGPLPPNQVYEWMGRAKALLFPSEWYEGLPLTIVEAFAKGTPVIASNLGAMATMVTPGRTGLHFEPGNVDDLVKQVLWMIDYPSEWQAMGNQARQEFEHNYTAARNYEMLIDVYQQALATKTSRTT